MPSSSDHGASLFKEDADLDDQWRTLSPYESIVGEILIDAIHNLSVRSQFEQTPSLSFPIYRPASITIALNHAAAAIRYQAKWFTPASISRLLANALANLHSSTSSAELHAGLALVESVVVYSVIPEEVLPAIARFLAYAYHQGARTNRAKRLADETWTILMRLLPSHLGLQMLDFFFLSVKDYTESLDQRDDYACAEGSLRILSRILFAMQSNLPRVDLVRFLKVAQAAGIAPGSMLIETIRGILIKILMNDVIVAQVSSIAGWDDMLAAASHCTRTEHLLTARDDTQGLMAGLNHIAPVLEPRNLHVLADTLLKVEQPLSDALSIEFCSAWRKRLLQPGWELDIWQFIDRLLRWPTYITVLEDLTTSSFSAALECQEDSVFLRFVNNAIARLKQSHDVYDQGYAVLGSQAVRAFRQCLQEHHPRSRRDTLFSILCQALGHDLHCASMLFQISADVEGHLYFRPDLDLNSLAVLGRHVSYDAKNLRLDELFDAVLRVTKGHDVVWEAYESLLTHLPKFLGNRKLFENHSHVVRLLKSIICGQLNTSLTEIVSAEFKTWTIAQLLQILAVIVSYHQSLGRDDVYQIISIYIKYAGAGDATTSVTCVHGLTICCYEVPHLMSSYMDSIIDKMSKMVTQRHVAIHVLQFLAGLSRLPDLYRNFRSLDYKRIFAVCQSYLQSVRHVNDENDNNSTTTNDGFLQTSEEHVPEYVYALAHHVVTFWYIAMSTHDRAEMKPYIAKFLTHRATDGVETLEDQGLVTIDMMDRVDAEATSEAAAEPFDHIDGRILLQNRLVGLLLVTTKTSLKTGKTLVHVRRPSGNSDHVVDAKKSWNDSLDSSLAKMTVECTEDRHMSIVSGDSDGRVYGRIIIPDTTSPLGAPTIITLPSDDATQRAIESLDRTPALDSHKTGVIYIGEGQRTEDEILRNSSGSPDYRAFINDLGTLQRLRGAKFNTQGLDRTSDYDGEHVVVWNNNVTELVYHITTLMPTSDDVLENTARKKRHIGNDFVNIIFNNSGGRLTYQWLCDVFPSDFGYVYIVITPASAATFIQARTKLPALEDSRFYNVNVLTGHDYPNMSSAAEEKTISGPSLAGFVRNLALNDCIVSLMKSPGGDLGEYPSSWRNRLQQLRRMTERYGRV